MSEINLAAVRAIRSIIDSLPLRQDICLTCGVRMGEAHTRMCDDKVIFQDYLDNKETEMDNREFLYHSTKKGQLQSWNIDFNKSVFFEYKGMPYMLTHGAWGIVCFNLNRAFRASNKTVMGFVPMCSFLNMVEWPNAKEQAALLSNLVR